MKRPEVAAAVLVWAATALPTSLSAQIPPPSSGGLVELDWTLQRLAEPRRVLMIGAHPDDEDTSLLSLLARGYGAEAAYLSLTRGEGGQNLIGEELGPALGLLRTRELEAARAIDGAQQFFTRAFDFGYTRSLEETAEKWPLDSLLKDAVRIVRRFRPHVVVSVFSGTPRDGHGQHQAAGVTARRAFEVAGDGAIFPELLDEEGLAPWRPGKLYRSTRFSPDDADLAMPTGHLDPRTGRSFHQIAMASRSQHRSQDMGQIQAVGPRRSLLQLLDDRTGGAPKGSLLDGVETPRSNASVFADSVRGVLDARDLGATARVLARRLERDATVAASDERPGLNRALAIAAGVVFDAVSDAGRIVAGESVTVRLFVYNDGGEPVHIETATVLASEGWGVEPAGPAAGLVESGEVVELPYRVTVPPDAEATRPYFLERPRIGDLYDWHDTPPAVRGMPFQPPVLRAQVLMKVHGVEVPLEREVTFRFGDQAVGERREEVRVVPLVEVALTPEQVVWPSDGDDARTFTVSLRYNGRDPYRGTAGLEVGPWRPPEEVPVQFDRRGDTRSVSFEVQRPEGHHEARISLRAVFRGGDGRHFDDGVSAVTYPHIRPASWVQRAHGELALVPMTLPTVGSIGYVRGAADRVPEALQAVGLAVEVFDEATLAGADLTRYDAIIVGARAYEVDDALTRYNPRLLGYTRRGGLLIVQYQQYQFVRGGYAPHSLEIGRPHDRVTDERSPVRVLDPDHPALRRPNPITVADWDGWPQERGLYFAGTWSDAYHPLVEMEDPGREPVRGGLLVAPYGSGTYVYTGLSFFRALPAGTPGAFRLFLNLLDLNAPRVP